MSKTKVSLLNSKRRLGWHFTTAPYLRYSDERLVAGKTYKATVARFTKDGQRRVLAKTTILCAAGLHASSTPADAFHHVAGLYVSRVEVWGDIKSSRNSTPKFAGLRRKVLWYAEVPPSVTKYGIYSDSDSRRAFNKGIRALEKIATFPAKKTRKAA